MKVRELFSIPEGKRITDKYFYRVLASSICGILLCMGCLVESTWAWFTVSIENTENIITVASEPNVTITINEISVESSSTLEPNAHIVRVMHASEVDDVQQKSILYVTFSLNEVVQGYVTLNHENNYSANVNITTEQKSTLSWTVSWFKPDNAYPLVDNLIELVIEEETRSTEVSTDPTNTETDTTGVTTQPTEGEKETAEETTQSTEAEIKSTETTVATESNTSATENST